MPARVRATQVVDPNYIQMVTQIPPENAQNNPAFVHDYFSSFTSTMFIGSEVGLYDRVLRAPWGATWLVLATRGASSCYEHSFWPSPLP